MSPGETLDRISKSFVAWRARKGEGGLGCFFFDGRDGVVGIGILTRSMDVDMNMDG